MMIGAVIYGLCACAALLCAGLLLKAYAASKYRLLLWGGLCFIGLTCANILLVLDKVFLPDVDLSVWRHVVTLISLCVFLYGLIFDTE
jgi:hydrogenase/urease accessory protein HupE